MKKSFQPTACQIDMVKIRKLLLQEQKKEKEI